MSSTLPLTGDGPININTVTPGPGTIKLQDPSSDGPGYYLLIWGSNAAGSSDANGGNIVLIPGSKSGSGNDGGVGIANFAPKGLLQLASSYIVAHAPSLDTTGAKDRANINAAIGELA